MVITSSFYTRLFRKGWLLIILWVVVQGVLLKINGVRTDIEGQVYINIAHHLLEHGSFSASKSWLYLLPILLIAAGIKTGAGYMGVVLVQVLVNGVATICFYRSCIRLGAGIFGASAAALLLIVFVPLQLWNSYLYTESLFISFAMICTYWVVQMQLTAKSMALVLLGLVLLLFTRPSGILFTVPVLLFFLERLFTGRYAIFKRLAIGGLAVLGVVLFINMVYKGGGGDLDIMKPYLEEHIICFVPSGNTPLLSLSHTGEPLSDLLYYITHNPLHFSRLFVLRLLAFFNLCRPYYSFAHNVWLVAVMLPLYSLVIAGLLALRRRFTPAHRYLLWLPCFYAAAIAFQCDDYHSRFIMVVMPVLFYFAGEGLGSLRSKMAKRAFSLRNGVSK